MNDAQAAELILAALPDVPVRSRLLVQIIGALESSYGQGWEGEGIGSHNWGAIQGDYQGESFTYTDHRPNPDDPNNPIAYEWQYRKYPDDESGIRDLWSLLERRYPEAVGAAEAGNWGSVSRALCDAGYYEGTHPDPEVNIARHRTRTLELYRRIQPAAYPELTPAVPPSASPLAKKKSSAPWLLVASAIAVFLYARRTRT